MSIDAGTIYSSIRIKLNQLESDVRQVQGKYNRLGQSINKSIGGTVKKGTKGFQNLNLAGVAAFAGIAIAVKQAISTFAKFEQSMANVGSVARATPEDFAKLTKAAKEAGETTRFTATQAADALYYLASAGYDAEKSMNALNGVLQLAGATGSDLAFTSSTVAASISQFNLEASEASRVANVFTAAITNSQANMNKLATSMQYVGPVASAMGMSLEQTIGILQILYNTGLEASSAGTALRGALADLADSSSAANKKLRVLGISFDEINPATNSFAEIIDVLNQHSITGADALTIFGRRAGPALIKLLQAGKDEIEKYTNAVTGTNAAAEAYERQNDTLAGSLDFLKSAWESLIIKFIKEVAPAIRGVVDILTQVVKVVANAPGPIKVFTGIMAAGIPIALGLAAAMFAVSMIMGTVAVPILGVVAGVAALTAGISFLVKQSNQSAVLQRDLKVAYENTEKAIKNYNETQKAYTKAIEEGNMVEADRLKNLKDLQALQIQANLAKTVNIIVKLQNEQDKQNKRLAESQKKYNVLLKELTPAMDNINSELQDWIRNGKENSDAVDNLRRQLKPYNYAISESTRKLTEKKLAIQENVNEQNKYIDMLAEAYVAEQITLSQLRMVDSEIANQILLRAEQIKKLREQKGAQDDLNDSEDKPDRKPAKDFWGDFAKSLRLATQEAEAFGDQSDVLEAKLAVIKNKYLELLKEGVDPNSNKMRQLMMLYETISGQLDIYNLKLDSQNAAEKEAIENKKRLLEVKQKHIDANKEIAETQDNYRKKLESLNQTTEDAIFKEWSHALAMIESSDASTEAIERARNAINEYYKTLLDKTATEEFKQNLEMLKNQILSFVSGLTGALQRLFAALTDARIAELDRQMEAELEARGISTESEIEKLNRELDEAKKANDKKTVEEKKKAIERAKIEEKFEKEKAKIQYKAAMFQWGLNLASAIAKLAEAINIAVASAPFPWNLPAIGFAGAIGGIQIATITAQKPQPPAFALGGVMLGPDSYEGGGIPAMLHPPEMILNTDQMQTLFNRINNNDLGGPVNITLIVKSQSDEEIGRVTETMANNGVITFDPKRALR